MIFGALVAFDAAGCVAIVVLLGLLRVEGAATPVRSQGGDCRAVL